MTRLLDISRLVRRAGRPMTGVDRVEFAYLRTLSARDEPLFCFARTPLGYVLLGHDGARVMARIFNEESYGPLDPLGLIARKRDEMVRRAEADLRRNALARALPQRLGAMLRKHLPSGTRYLNIGHSNLTDRVISAVRSADCRIAVMVHDVIPLDAPEWQRPESVAAFKRFMARVNAHADLVLYNSRDTETRTKAHLTRSIDCVVAHLGVELAPAELLPEDLEPRSPYFVTLGTIEPRKNHAMLLDLWEEMGETAPQLVIAGRRGWQNEDVFARLDAGPANITEAPGLSDGAITTLLKGSHGLLFPSSLEGFGLPPMEAAALDVPVICQPLPVLTEVMRDIPIYAKASEPYHWQSEIEKLAEQRHTPGIFVPPTWTDHFNTVLMLT